MRDDGLWESVCVMVWERDREKGFVWWLRERERGGVSVMVEREREREGLCSIG